MVETRTARMRLVQWSSGTDSPQRVDFNETFANIENLAAIDQQGTLANRPNPNNAGLYYFATDVGTLYRSDGLSWAVVGASVLSQYVKPSKADAVAQTIQGLASQTADLQRVLSSSNVYYQRVRSNGDLIHGPLRVFQAARTLNDTTAVPSDSAVTVDNGMNIWNTTFLNSTGNTAGFVRAVLAGNTVFSVLADGSVITPKVTLRNEPTEDASATTKRYVDDAIKAQSHDLGGESITGTLPVSKGGTGATSPDGALTSLNAVSATRKIATGDGLLGGGDLSSDRRLSVDYGASGASTKVSREDHKHDLGTADSITGILGVEHGGTGSSDAATAISNLGATPITRRISAGPGLTGGGDLVADRSISVSFAGSGTANTVARSDHGHKLADLDATGFYPKPSAISTASGPNNIKTAGIYTFSEAASTDNGWPVNGWGVLEVLVGGDAAVQRWTSTKNGLTYVRYGIPGATWSQWKLQGGEYVVQPLSLPGWRFVSEAGGMILTIGDNGQKRLTMHGAYMRTGVAFNTGMDWMVHGTIIPPSLRRTAGQGASEGVWAGQIENVNCLTKIDLVSGGFLTLTSPNDMVVYPGASVYINASWWITPSP